jgi:cytochrome b561
MQWLNTRSRYGFVGVSLHWMTVAAIIAQYVLAEAAKERESEPAGILSAANLHTSLGIAVLALAVLRLLWRLVELPPTPPVGMKPYEIAMARVVHIVFYFLLFAIPLSGWALATTDHQPLSFFGLFELPQLRFEAQLPIGDGTLDKEQLETVHEVLFNVLLGLALLHVAAALKHHFFDHDGVLRSMLPGRKREQAS